MRNGDFCPVGQVLYLYAIGREFKSHPRTKIANNTLGVKKNGMHCLLLANVRP